MSLLPCCHVLYLRLHNGNEYIIPPLSFYASRWMLRNPINDLTDGEVEGGGFFKRTRKRMS
ncbi:hypothetical protein GN958_ATG17029 [Phytophthora infestans]|uniref:Uncharacterized protein n=1 Tax=Phytophthora infestans TaxID=4787 RepID=A0A8S9U1T2_PHYIN|nr:hypothetical protein GN958_ATG17029 [Phytophthora infestans]